MNQMRPFAPRTDRIVGRANEIEAIRTALADPEGRTHILYFAGLGGIGKTRLLEEVVHLAAEIGGDFFVHEEIIDLYHPEFHSAEGVQTAIADGLDPGGEHFQEYRRRRERFEERRRAGVSPEVLREERTELIKAFLANFNRMAAERRILLRIDTLELIQHESDRVQEVCRIEEEVAAVRQWLLDVLPRLRNAVVLLAARPPAPLRAGLTALCKTEGNGDSLVFRDFDLKGLTWKETQAYFNALAKVEPQVEEIPGDVRRRIWLYTEGRPIRLSLVIDLALYGRAIADLFPLSEAEEGVTDEETRIDERLMGELVSFPLPVRQMLYYLALARKGLNADLLQRLAPEWEPEECYENLERMRRFTFVKPWPGTDMLFLHDELYELFDRFVLGAREEYHKTRKEIARYYVERQKQAQTPQEQDVLKANRMYYELQLDPWEAFWRYYVPWDEEAVRAFDMDLDMQLRDELLRFLKEVQEDSRMSRRLPRDVVDRDAAVRWVRRYLSRGEHRRAVDVGQRILESDLEVFQSSDPLYRSALVTAYAEALIYTGVEEEKVMALLNEAIEALEAWQPEGEEDPRRWWKARVLGRAYNNRGYLHRQAGRNGAAIQEYRRALWEFRQANILDEMAETLTNIGFVYARWGRTTEAEAVLQDAIDLRERLGQELGRGLSLNTLGLVHVFDDVPMRGQRRCEEALAIFERLEHQRGIGLAHNALGLALRKRAEQWKVGTYSLEEAEDFFKEAVKHLEEAKRIFTRLVDEPLRLWETYNELGSTYCDWAWLLLQQGRADEAGERYDLAEKYLQESIQIAEEHGF
ncbi:MAG TPA: ATP-binding protein, partial [Anaerolineae bacterium]|nr:ATP-binding protein [Anaerolineae bacterium]